ncbi:MAG: HEAT repeat domain-containing protein [Deltaproteobacteria bacterium]|nr:HEAT repeat domain-containing protein [Deltaproteobacteria bacterium]
MIVVRLVVVLVLLGAAATVRGDDWEVTRSPFDPRVVARYKALLARNAGDATSLSALVRLYRQHRSIAALVAEYQALARAHPASVPHQLVLAHLYRRVGRATEALAQYERVAKLSPKNASVAAALGALYGKAGRATEAMEAYRRAVTLSGRPGEKKTHLRTMANLALAQRDVKGAMKIVEELLGLDPRNTMLRTELAQLLAKSGQERQAVDLYREVLKRTSETATRAELLKEIGTLLHQLGRDTEAVDTFQKAMGLAARGHYLQRELTDRIIDIYRKKDDLKGLITHYEKTWKRRGAFEHQVLGRLYEETGDEAKALKEYRSALALARQELDVRVRLIGLLDRMGRDKEVVAEYRTLAQLAPGEAKYHLELAKRLHRAGAVAEATQVLDRLGQRFPSDASVHSALSDLFSRWGDQKRAMREAQILVRIEPKDDGHLISLGEQYFASGQKKKAVEVWRKLLTTVKERHQALAKLAEVYAQHDLTKEAIDLYRKAIKLAPHEVGYAKSLAALLEQKRMNNEAIAAWEDVLKKAQGDGHRQSRREARTRILDILARTYQLQFRMRGYQMLFDRNPPDVDAGLFLAEGHLKLKAYELAATAYRRILQHHATHAEAMVALEAVYRRQRKLAEAVKLLKRLAELQPKNAREYYQRIANLQVQLSNDKEALLYAHKAIAAGPHDAPAYLRLAQLYERRQDFQSAVQAYRKALEINPALHRVHFALARLQTWRGEYDDADRIYRQLVRSGQTPEVAQKAFQLALDLCGYLGRLESLERDLVPLAQGSGQHAEVYRRMVVEVLRRRVPPLVRQARYGSTPTQQTARAELRRIGQRSLGPLLDELASGSTGQRELVRMLGYLGNPGAVLPLLRVAEREADEEVFTIYGSASSYYGGGYSHIYSAAYGGPGLGRSEQASGRMALRLEALVAIGRLADGRAVPGLVRLLGSREGALRDAAAWALAQQRDSKAQAALFKALGDSRPSVQLMACAGLGAQQNRELRPVLEEVLHDGTRSERVRAACAWGLGALRDPRALGSLVQATDAPDDELQASAAMAIARLGDRRGAPHLVRALWVKRPTVRAAMLRGLSLLGATTSAPAPGLTMPEISVRQGQVDVDAFAARLFAAGAEVDSLGAEQLAWVIEQHGPLLLEGLKSALDRHRDVVLRALHDLDGPGGRLGLGPFTSGLERLDNRRRQQLERTMAHLGMRLESPLARFLSHGDSALRTAALTVYAKLARHPLLPLRRAAQGANWSTRVAALRSLEVARARGVISSKDLLADATRAARGAHYREREAAAEVLASLGKPGRELLATLSRDANGFVREAALVALGRSGDAEGASSLVAGLSDEATHVRATACRVLGTLRLPGTRAAVTTRLRDPSARVRAAAEAALAHWP